jgi:transposase
VDLAEIENLPSDADSLRQIILEKSLALLKQEEKVERLIDIIRQLKRHQFGSRSEKLNLEQLGLFNEAEAEALEEAEEKSDEETVKVPGYTRKKPKRKPLPENIPREEKIIELAEEERRCPTDGNLMAEIGEEVSEKLDVIPMQLKVIRTVRKKYACRHCAEGVKTAPVPASAIPKSLASEGLLAAIVTWKFADHLPLYRIENMFSRVGVELSRTTMAHWMIKMGTFVQPLINLLSETLLDSGYLQMDETKVQVLKEKGKRAQSLSYMWVRARPGIEPIILFDYDPTRSGEVPQRLLGDFDGILQVDGYGGYNKISENLKVIRAGCFAHCRRRFFEASKASKNTALANIALKWIRKLYQIEDEIREKTARERYEARQLRAAPLINEMKEWITKVLPTIPPKTAIGNALSYAESEWRYLTAYLDHGEVEIDNNFIENKIRPFALGRKNWLFCDSVDGANASANLYSLLVTALANGLDPYQYLRYVFERLPLATELKHFEALLPAAAVKDLLRQ